jgi:hypothetical protein
MRSCGHEDLTIEEGHTQKVKKVDGGGETKKYKKLS